MTYTKGLARFAANWGLWVGAVLSAPHLACASCVLPVQHEERLNIEACGANVAKDDNKRAIDEALAAAESRYQGIYIPAGIFLTSGGHNPPTGVGVYGSGTLKLLSKSSSPVIDTTHSRNVISGISFDLSDSGSASRVAIDIDGGSSDIVVSDVSVNFGRIIAYVTNGGAPPSQIEIRHNLLTSAITGGTAGGAIDINSHTSHFLVSGNRVNGNWDGKHPDQRPGNGAGIDVESGSSYGEISQNDTYNNSGSGIYVLSGLYITVSGNNCSENRQSGIGVNSNGDPRPGHLAITANVCSHNVYDGIDVNEAGPLKYIYINISGNYLAWNGPAPGGGGTGIVLAYAGNVAISSNTIHDNSVAGIWMNSSENIAVTGNILSGNSRTVAGAYPGILLVNSSRNTFTGNIASNDGGVPSQNYGIEERDSASDYNTYTGNSLQPNLKGGLHVTGTHDVQAGNL